MSGALRFRSAALTNVGLKRTLNEDAVLDRPEIGLWVVADGMGGHGGGDVASRAIVDALAKLAAPNSASTFLDQFEASVSTTHRGLRDFARREGKGIVGATLAALLIYDHHFACVWCGDSRVYLLRDGKLSQVSHDHSEVQELVDRGALDKADAKSWPRANVVTRAIGASEALELEIVDSRANAGDRYLLCSDGLSAHVEDAEIAVAIQGADPRATCDKLIALTLQRGARDNVSVIAVFCEAG